MALPTSYSEVGLADYMVRSLGGLAEMLGLDESAMSEAVNDVAHACGVQSISQAHDLAMVRALARVAALRVARTAAAGWYDFGADGGDYKRSQVVKQIGDLLAAAERDALIYDPGYGVEIGVLRYRLDPYGGPEDDLAAEGAG